MAGKTKLYQRTGSPLIQGSSKRAVPFWKVWLRGGLYGLALGWVAMFVSLTLNAGGSGPGYVENAVNAAIAMLTAGLPGLVLGSWFATALARGMGWRRTPVIAGVVSALLALASIYVAYYWLGWSLRSLW